MDIEQEIADEISGIQVGSGYYSTTIGIDAAQEAAAALMPLLNRVRAEALREAARFLRDFHSEYESAETLEMYAREIEQNSEGNET